MTFLDNPSGLSPAAFKSYVATCRWPVWKPKFIVLHNTAEPNLKQWAYGNDGKDHEYQRILNLNRYYKSLGWHSGPHLFISPNLIWVACDLAADGVHASCYNADSLGVEMVGDYSDEAFDSGDGAKVRDLTVAGAGDPAPGARHRSGHAALPQGMPARPPRLPRQECGQGRPDRAYPGGDGARPGRRIQNHWRRPRMSKPSPQPRGLLLLALRQRNRSKKNPRLPMISALRRFINSGSPTASPRRKPAAFSRKQTPKARSIPRRLAITGRPSASTNGIRRALTPSATAAASIFAPCRRWRIN